MVFKKLLKGKKEPDTDGPSTSTESTVEEQVGFRHGVMVTIYESWPSARATGLDYVASSCTDFISP